MQSGGGWGVAALVAWRLFQREKALDDVNREARQLAADTAASNAKLATLIETLMGRK
jgi:hypothetical protein